ncbi:hypothetical protein [Longimycelium tulufanense]|uniref:hypothetical protein n=1 Tax=Longimycelium tulufanense TaxID=907463 RepID=UPI00166511D9|nr:hypothetical protein [Longimycelium tulufanense]
MNGCLPKPFLQHWAARMVAENAVDNLGGLVSIAMNDRSGAVDYLKRAPTRSVQESADTGTAVHDLFERIARGEHVGRVSPEIEPYRRYLVDFHDRYQPRYHFVEDTVWSDRHRYAGSFDFLGDIEEKTVLGDLKTTRSGIHAEVALQLAAYAHADRIITQNGASVDIPEVTGGVVLHVRPEGWSLVPVRIDANVFEFFLHLRRVFDWVHEVAETVKGTPLCQSAASTGSQRRRTH